MRGHGDYIFRIVTVPLAAVNQELDLMALVAGRATPPGFLRLTVDADVLLAINDAANDSITVNAGVGAFEIPATADLEIRKLYFTHIGAGSAAGDVTVTVLAV